MRGGEKERTRQVSHADTGVNGIQVSSVLIFIVFCLCDRILTVLFSRNVTLGASMKLSMPCPKISDPLCR